MPRDAERPFRVEAVEHCTILRENGSLAGACLEDVSDEGFCITTSHPLEVGERIELRTLGLGQLAGVIRWSERNRSGGVLERYLRGAFDVP